MASVISSGRLHKFGRSLSTPSRNNSMDIVVAHAEPLVNHASVAYVLDDSIQNCGDYRVNIVRVFQDLSVDTVPVKITHANISTGTASTETKLSTLDRCTDIASLQSSNAIACIKTDIVPTCESTNKTELYSDGNTKPLDARPKTLLVNKLHNIPESSSPKEGRLNNLSGGASSKKKKQRSRSTKKWRTVNPSELGFDLSLLSSLPPEDLELGPSLTKNDNGNTPIATCTTETNEDQVTSDIENNNSFLAFDNDRDAAFFLSLGIDVYAEDVDSDDNAAIDWDGVHGLLSHSKRDRAGNKSTNTAASNVCNTKSENSPKLKGTKHFSLEKEQPKKSTSCLKTLAESLESSLPTPSFPVRAYIKKSDSRYLYELECVSSKKVYLRRDRHRRVEKAHKAVKSKNCKSILNNRGRKTLYMHHRLVKMHDLNLDFRCTSRPRSLPAMPKMHIDPSVAKSMFRADRNSGRVTNPARPAPAQNLRHTLHETNAPGHLDLDLASFLISLQHREMTPEDYEMLLRLDESVKPKTVSKTLLSSLKTETVGPEGFLNDSDILCTICMEPYAPGDKRKFLPCEHHFHSNCIDTWLTNSSMNCPLDGLPVDSS